MALPDATGDQLLQVLDQLARILNEHKINYALIGGLGVAVRGPIRATRDIDLLITVPQLELPAVFEALAQAGFGLDVAAAIAIWNRDHLLDFAYGTIRVDWLKPVLPAFDHILGRARWVQIGDRPIRVADAEGRLLLKLIAFRARDQEDIKGLLAANAGALDLDWVRQEWGRVAGDDDPRTASFEQFVADYYPSPDSAGS